MNEAKIRLSATEMELVKNADWILTKNSIMERLKEMLAALVSLQMEIIYESKKGFIPEEVQRTTFKISRGENYQGLPWLVLDHPRFFSREDIMAIRSLFWWGRCFSVTLHLCGKYKSQFERSILSHYDSIQKSGNEFFVCINDSQWEHHFEASNYRCLRELDRTEWQQLILEKPFIKIAKKVPLEQLESFEAVNDLLAWHYFSLIELLEKMND